LAARRLNLSPRQYDGEFVESVDSDTVRDPSLCKDTSEVDSEQYCSLLESLNSVVCADRLVTVSETGNDRLENDSSNIADGDLCEQVKKEELYKTETVAKMLATTFADSKVGVTAPNMEEIVRVCNTATDENTDRFVGRLNPGTDLAISVRNDCDRPDVYNSDVISLIVERGSMSTNFTVNSNADLSVEEYINEKVDDDNDDDDKPLVELCSKKAGYENGFDVGDEREFLEHTESDETADVIKLSDNVLWKEGDIEVRLEIGEDESSNLPECDDDVVKTVDKTTDLLSPGDCNSDVPVSKMPRTSIRISLSKLTARISGDDTTECLTNLSKELAFHRRGQVKGLHMQKLKVRKKRIKLRRPKSDSANRLKLSEAKSDESGKPRQSQDVDSEPVIRRRGRPRKSSQLRPVETTVSGMMNGICTRRRQSTSDGRRMDTSNTMTELSAKSESRDATVCKPKKHCAIQGVEYIDDDAASSPRHADDCCRADTTKKTTGISHVDERNGTEVDTSSQFASDKENEKYSAISGKMCISTHNLNVRKQATGKKHRKSYSGSCDRNDGSAHSDSCVTNNAANVDDAGAEDIVPIKRSRNVSSSIEDNQADLDIDDKSKMHCTAEEMFRQIGRDGLECRFCHCELRTRTQLLQHAKIQCHLQQKLLPSNVSSVEARKCDTSESDLPDSLSEKQCQVDAEYPTTGSDEAEKKTDTFHVDAINGVQIKNCVVEISPLTETTDVKNDESVTDTEQKVEPSDDLSDKAYVAVAMGDAMATVCDGCGEVVPDCSWLTAHIVTCPGRSGTSDESEINSESFQQNATQWSGGQENALVPESGLEHVVTEASAQPVEVDAASLLQLLCTVENSMLCTVPSENDVSCQSITVVSDSLLQEDGTATVSAADGSQDAEQFGCEVVHDGVAMYEFAEYRCSKCPLTFLDRAMAVQHATTTKVHTACSVEHTSIYCCMQCDMRYRDQQLMWYHVTYICQQSEAAAVPASEVHRCAWCTKQFLTAEYLSWHCHIQHSTEMSSIDSLTSLRRSSASTGQLSTISNSDIASSETQKEVLQALARATKNNASTSSPKSRKEAALLRSKLVIPSDALPTRKTAKGIVYKNVFMQCIVSYICSNCGRDLSTKAAKREHRVAAPDSCFDSGPGGRRLFTYVRHYSYLCPYCSERSATQKACRAHQLATCLPRMGVKTDELNHKQLLCPFCQRKYFNVITLKGHMTLVHQISRAESNRLLAGVTGASEEVSAFMPNDSDRAIMNIASRSDSMYSTATRPLSNMASIDSIAGDDENSGGWDDDSHSIKSESASHDSCFETVDSSLPLFTSSNSNHHDTTVSSDESSENDDVNVDSDDNDSGRSDDEDRSAVLIRHRFSSSQKPKRTPLSQTKKSSSRKS